MKPYYQDDWVTIYHGDCREVLPELEAVELLLTDPPYGVLADSGSAATRRSGGKKTDGKISWDIRPSQETLELMMLMADKQMIWGGCHLNLGPTFGYLVWDKKIDGLNFGEVEFCWTNMKFAPRIFRYRAVGVDGGKVHPTQKPESLMRFCMIHSETQGNVLDPFMGSGTTLRAAKDLKSHAIGIEIEEKYCEIAARRMSQEVLI